MAKKIYPRSIKTAKQKAAFTKALNVELKKGRKTSYAKRIASNIARGKTKQQARGHKAKEHIERKEREIAESGITKSQLESVRAFLERFNPHGVKGVPTEEDLVEDIQDRGYGEFIQYRKTWDAVRRAYLREQKDGTYENRGWSYLVMMQDRARAPDAQWMYYH